MTVATSEGGLFSGTSLTAFALHPGQMPLNSTAHFWHRKQPQERTRPCSDLICVRQDEFPQKGVKFMSDIFLYALGTLLGRECRRSASQLQKDEVIFWNFVLMALNERLQLSHIYYLNLKTQQIPIITQTATIILLQIRNPRILSGIVADSYINGCNWVIKVRAHSSKRASVA